MNNLYRFTFSLFLLLFSDFPRAGEIRFIPPEMKKQLKAALAKQGNDYQPRTKNLLKDGRPAFVNRLILEDSPYLQQHAHNPVNWFPWGEEAFARAKKENKPVFLSIGYSTCHWCHVMEEESFDDPKIAKILNEHFISIKVDRERRPDVDAVYMTAVQMIMGSGGWPMSSFLTPDGKTFLGGTYFQPEKFKQLLVRVSDLWNSQRTMLVSQAEQISSAVARQYEGSRLAQKIDQAVIQTALNEILQRHDDLHGGFGHAPKFPNESWLLFLLDQALRNGNQDALEAVESSLQAMARGGIYDQVGGGFHRYSTDEQWMIPHFEKMLYNQALLAEAYLYAYQLTGHSFYARIARETLDYVLKEMTSPKGGFYSASDADSEEGEGVYFMWSMEEIRKNLPKVLAPKAIEMFGISEQGNFEGRNILHLPVSLEEYAEKTGTPRPLAYQELETIRAGLYKARSRRTPPFRDEKILTAWNAMMINTLAVAAEILQKPKYLVAAERAANFIWQSNHRGSGRLWRIYLNGRSSMEAGLDDYAFLADAYLQLYDTTSQVIWLERAKKVARVMLDDFSDEKEGGFFMSAATSDNLMARPKEISDGATPSANAAALQVLSKLSKRVPDPEYNRHAEKTLAAFSSKIKQSPSGYATMLTAAGEMENGESGHYQYAAKGAVSIKAQTVKTDKENRLIVDITIQPGWHINAHHPLQDYLIPTSIRLSENSSGWKLGKITYPAPLKKKLGFQRATLALYEGEIELNASLMGSVKDNPTLPVQVRLQACNDKICLPPETILLQVPVNLKTI